jgi:hypothetical protein
MATDRKEYMRKYHRKYYLEHKEQEAGQRKKWRLEHQEKIKVKNEAYYATHQEEIKAYRKTYYAIHKEHLIQRGREYKLKNKEYWSLHEKEYRISCKRRVFDHYGNKCACCGESTYEFLTIDHVNNDGAKHRRELGKGRYSYGGNMASWLIKNNFPKGFQILCFNCNCAKGLYGKCPHNHLD